MFHIRKMRHAEYTDSLLKKTRSIATTMIRSYERRVYSEHVTKVALSPFDDKRYVLENGYSTLAHFIVESIVYRQLWTYVDSFIVK